jgi:autotransporter-associated beta strand protein
VLSANGTITVNIAGDSTVMSVGQFPLIKYTTRTGNGAFVLGSLPVNVTAQIVTNAAAKSIDLKVTSAPVTTWVGNLNNLWDINNTANWSILGVGGKKYLDGVGVFFGDSVMTNLVDITTAVSPSSTLVNSTNDYEFAGLGYLNSGDLTKSGSGKLTLLTANYYNNTTIAGGTLQVDTNGTSATLGSGNVDVEGTLIFDRADAITVGNTITGAGTVVNNGGNSVTLSAANTYSGGTLINQGEVILGTTASLGAPASGVPMATVASGATLDINGKLLTIPNATRISGSGYTGGAIINSGGGTCVGCGDVGINNVSLTADATVLVNSDWVVGASGLGISGNGFNLTKLGYGAIYLRASAPTAFATFTVGGGTALIESANPFGTGTTLILSNNAATDSWGNNAGGPVNYTIANNIIVTNGGGRITTTRGHWWSTPDYDTYTGAITLNDNLTVQNSSINGSLQGKLTVSGPISGTGGITKMGAYPVTLSGVNTYSGSTTVANGTLVLSPVSQGGGAYTNLDGATLAVPAQSGYSTLPMSELALGSASGSTMDLSGVVTLSSSVAPITATNLVLTGVNSILLSGASYATAGQYPLIKYTTLTGGVANLALGVAGVRGVPGYFSNNVTRGSIDLVVVPGSNPVNWVGNLSTNWDIATTLNWSYQSAVTDYEQSGTLGDAVTFDDSTAKTNIFITTSVSPTLVIANTTNAYKFFGTNLTGSTALVKSGTGSLILGNYNNNLTGGGEVNAGSLVLGTGGTFAGTFGVASGATLDLGSNTISALVINASGAGVGGNGAIQANYAGAGAAQGVSIVNQTGNLTVGGNNRWDVRNGSKQWNVNSNGATLTKVGAGYVGLNGVTVSTNLGDITILGGTLSYQAATTGLGNTNNTIYVGNGATLDFNSSTIPLTKSIVCSNGAAIASDGGNAANLNVVSSPVNITGSVNLNFNYYNGGIFSNTISGAGGLNLQVQSIIKFAASNTFTGNITVPRCGSASGSDGLGTRLFLIGNGSITHSALITLQGLQTGQAFPGFLDVLGRPDKTLTLGTNQILRGDNGSFVRGSVVATAGSGIAPGGINNSNYQYMCISNSLTFQAGSTNYMDIYKTATLRTNDLITVSNLVTYGGTLQIQTNGSAALIAGDTFQLFSAGSSSGNFATIADTSGATWSFNPLTGVAMVLTPPPTINPSRTNIVTAVSGNQLTMSWPADHTGWTLQSNSVSLLNTGAWATVSGSTTTNKIIVTMDPTQTNVFYRMKL